ncbi:MAG: antitermination protein NusG [Planctomycetaceae bacterium]|nr:antitermination protein NusG [Planctomycetaceae bacterium]
MPILARQPHLYPDDLLERARCEQQISASTAGDDEASHWWALYTLSRREKLLMRKLQTRSIPFYCPLVERRQRAPSGRVRSVFEPLFSNYVFLYGNSATRYSALTTNCISRCLDVTDGLQLTDDLTDLERLIEIGAPLSREERLTAGCRVRVKQGMFAGFEGTILRRDGEARLLVAVNFMQQGASVVVDDCLLEEL